MKEGMHEPPDIIKQINQNLTIKDKMKKILIIILTLSIVVPTTAQKIGSYKDYVETVSKNNSALKALSLTLDAQKSANRVGITPSDPEVETAPLFDGSLELIARSLILPFSHLFRSAAI